MTCQHRYIKTFDSVKTSTKYWACSECRGEFVPLQELAMYQVQRLGQEIEDFNEVEELSNLGKQILREIKPQHTWIGLTDSEKNKMAFIAGSDKHWLIRLVEDKLKEQNETT
jgi:hypothetical protein